MKLSEFLKSLKTENVLCVISDLEGTELAKVYASSYDALDDTLNAREVKNWQITGANQLAITLKDATISA